MKLQFVGKKNYYKIVHRLIRTKKSFPGDLIIELVTYTVYCVFFLDISDFPQFNFISIFDKACEAFFFLFPLVEGKMKLYSLDDGPPSVAVRMVFKALDLPYEDVPVDYNRGEHLGDDYAKVK